MRVRKMQLALADDEARRLEVLDRYRILDTPSGGELDDLVRLAALITQTPIALVTLLDRDRFWFKGRYGLETDDIPLPISFCAHTILNPDEPLEVFDATIDSRFRDSELVTGPDHLRYYLGAAVVTAEGYALGVLCVLDRRPRQLSSEQKQAVSILSRQVMKLLEMQRQMRDITNRKRAENDLRQSQEALKVSEARLRLAVETAELGTYQRDLVTNEIMINESCRRILGLSTAPPPPDVAQRSVHPEDKARVLAAVERAFNPALREVCAAEFRIVRSDGSICWVAGRGRVIFDDSTRPPRPCRFIGVLNDITGRKRLEAELQNQAASLERVVQERTARLAETVAELEHFSYTITHDMRAPLRAMRGFASMLLEPSGRDLDEATRSDLLRRIAESALRMDMLITGALDYSLVIRSELPLKKIEPTAVLRGIVDSYPQFHSPKAEIEIQPDMPPVLANEAALTQCFSNLLGNAAKFVPPGVTPVIQVWAELRGPDTAGAGLPADPAAGHQAADRPDGLTRRVRIWVKDNGIGIAPEHRERIWLMFQRLSKNYEGTGIGLALVLKVVERMGGEVGVESEPGRGSRFWVELRSPN